MRDALLAKIQAQYDEDAATPPVVTLDEYFTGNSSTLMTTTNTCSDPKSSPR